MSWRNVTLGDVIALQRGHDLPEQMRRPGTVPVLGSAGINGYHDSAKADGPGVVIGRSGASFGKAHYTPRAYWPHNTVLYVKDFKGNNPRFVYYLLDSIDFASFNSGSAQPSLNRNYLYGLGIRFPAFPVQTKIAAILSTYDDLIEKNMRRIKILEEMAQAIYREWFVKFRFPGHQKVKMVDSPMGKIPEGWEVKILPDAATVKYGKNLPTKNLVPDGKFPVYGAAKIIGRHTEYTREERTLITGCRGSVGEMQITQPKCFITNNSFTFDMRQGNCFFWLYYSLKERGFNDVIGGAAQPQITLDGLSKVQLLLPDEDLRSVFHEHVEGIFYLLWNLENRNQNLRQTRDLLLPKLISGKVEVSALDIKTDEIGNG